jgi:hypothetical protein
MERPHSTEAVIPRAAVRLAPQAAQIDCTSRAHAPGTGTLVVVPLVDGPRVAGLQIRCSCGATAVIECIYEEQPR